VPEAVKPDVLLVRELVVATCDPIIVPESFILVVTGLQVNPLKNIATVGVLAADLP
jgi:hypothetical protein